MRLYRTADGIWCGTQADAVRAARIAAAGRYDQVDVPTDKPGLLAWLNAGGHHPVAHPSVEAQPPATPPPTAPVPIAPAPSYADRSLGFEDAWAAFPLALKLHFAALAMYAARTALAGGAEPGARA